MADYFNIWFLLIGVIVFEIIAVLFWYEQRYAATDKITKRKIIFLYLQKVLLRINFVVPCMVIIYSIWNMFRETYNNPYIEKTQFFYIAILAFQTIGCFLVYIIVLNKLNHLTDDIDNKD